MSDRNWFPRVSQQRIIGLTGGVGMGKTTVSNYLASAHHLPVLDADIYARDAVQPGEPVLQEIIERYGPVLLLPDGHLDRMRLGEVVFNNPSERIWLEQRIHPYVRHRITTTLANLAGQSPIVVVVIPLLFEARMTDLVNEIWVVRCPLEQQIERLMQREVEGSHLNRQQAQTRIDSQMEIERKVQRADVVIENASNLEALYRQVDAALHHPAAVQSSHPKVGHEVGHRVEPSDRPHGTTQAIASIPPNPIASGHAPASWQQFA